MTNAATQSFAFLHGLQEEAFVGRRLPVDVIEAIEQLVNDFASSGPKEREEMVWRVDASFRFIFERYAFYAAQEAIRQNSPGLVKRGLIALAIENTSRDWRDTIPLLALLYRSASKLNMEAVELFDEVAQSSFRPFRKLIEDYDGRRLWGFRPIESFNYREAGEGNAFAYEYIPPPGLGKTGTGETAVWEFTPSRPRLLKLNLDRLFRRLRSTLPGIMGSK